MEHPSNALEIDADLMADQIKCLVFQIDQQISHHNIQMKNLVQTRSSLQNICPHRFESEGRDHVYHYEKCTICGLSRKA